MRKLIHTNWEIDLSNLKISDREDNSAFSDTFSSKITYPFEIDLDDDLDKYFGFISLYETNPETIYDCYYFHNDKHELAKLEILEVKGRKLSLSYEFGLEQFPNWDKKLSELPLEDFDLPEGLTIYEHAETIISQTYPAVNYNFPQIHTDNYDLESVEFEFFEKIINNRKNGLFLENQVDNNYVSINKNIIQPLPNIIYLLNTLVSDTNHILEGDILNDNNLLSRYVRKGEFKKEVKEKLEFNEVVLYGEMIGESLSSFISFPSKGVYRLVGDGLLITNSLNWSSFRIFYNQATVFAFDTDYSAYWEPTSPNHFSLDIFIVVNGPLTIEVAAFVPEGHNENYTIPLVEIIFYKVYEIDDYFNSIIPSVVNENKINLKKSVPDMTCGELITQLKNWFNYGFDVVPGKVIMNKISNSIDRTKAISLQEFEVKEPLVKYQSGMSFLHQFTEIDSKEYVYKKVFQDRNGSRTENYTVDSKTNVIEVNALPLPNTTREGVTTAHAFEDDESKLYLVEYDGLINGQNLSKSNTSIFLENCLNPYFFEWLKFRIFAKMFVWDFYSNTASINSMNVKDVIYCYNNYHIIKSLQKTEELPEVFKIEIETETISS